MKAYSKSVNAGVIKGADGRDYQFSKSQWNGDEPPQNNQSVDFDGFDHNQAQQVRDVK